VFDFLYGEEIRETIIAKDLQDQIKKRFKKNQDFILCL
jgi:hypothetical protein